VLVPLEEFAIEKGQTAAAQLLGMSQGALSKAIRMKRHIVVERHPDGSFSATEMRPFPSQGKAASK
jgi:hypothetical protein